MAEKSEKLIVDEAPGPYILRSLREGGMWILICFALYLIVSLASYYPDDPGWTFTGAKGQVQNSGGRAGAWFADVALYFFGLFAYLLPLMVVWSAMLLFRHPQTQSKLGPHILTLRWFGFFVTLTAGSALLALLLPKLSLLTLPTGTGGILGASLSKALLAVFNPVGTTLFLLALLLSGFTLMTGLSWFLVMDGIGAGILILGRWALTTANAFPSWYARLREQLNALRARWFSRENKEPTEPQGRLEPHMPVMPTPAEGGPKPVPVTPQIRAKRNEARVVARAEAKRVEPSINIPDFIAEDRDSLPPLPDFDVEGDLPSLSLLDPPAVAQSYHSEEALQELSRQAELKLADFGVDVHVVAAHPGPVVTLLELQLAPGTKVSKVTTLAKDLARALSVLSVRVVEVIPGKSVIGLEIPNPKREMVYLSEILSSSVYQEAESMLTLALGKDIAGHPTVADLGKMPHALIAGTTGSGKSVAINAMILSLLYKASAKDVRLIMIDPKMLELSVYEGIPHLLTPVVTDMKEAANALRWCVGEMERRYRLMAALGVRNIAGFNRKILEAQARGQEIPDPLFPPELMGLNGLTSAPPLMSLPYIVVVIDELADMMMVVGKKVEELIARLAQKARASGIHLLLATQRPSVDVITGLIKANIPTRIAFQVSSRIDSRTILDQMGAEHLLGHGDMLYLAPGGSLVKRIHGAFVDDNEVHRVVQYLKQTGRPEYITAILQDTGETAQPGATPESGGDVEETDELFDEAVRIVTESRRASISNIQRRLKIGYNRAARLIEEMERLGIVGPQETNGNREVLAPPPPEE